MLSATNRPVEMRRKGTGLSLATTTPAAASRGAMATELQVQELIAFLDWKDPGQSNAEYARRMLAMHPLAEVGVAMRDKFKFLPAGWRSHVPFTATLPEVEPTVSDLKVDEIIETEQRFLNVISEVLDTYVGELFKIYTSADQRAIASLGLTLEEVLLIFDRLQLTRQFSLLLLHELECISCIRAKPVSGEGRAVHVGQAFLKMAPRLYDLFAPAVVGYTEATRLVARATERVNKQNRKSMFKLVGAGGGADKATFLTLWDSVTSESLWLRQKQLGSVLITPMQRLTRYELLLSVLVKDCDHADAVPVVEQALQVVSVAVARINDSMLEQQDKANEDEAAKFAGRTFSASESNESKSSLM